MSGGPRARLGPGPPLTGASTAAAVTHLAIDWVARNWYLVDGGREALYVCERELRSCRLLLDSGLNKVHGFALDPTAGLMFWTVWGAAPPAVGRAELGGGGRLALAALKLVYPSALTLDAPTRTLYWVDTYLECVERADYDGGNRFTVRRGYVVGAARSVALRKSGVLPKLL